MRLKFWCDRESENFLKTKQGLKKEALFTSTQNLKFFKILRHIESLNVCMEY